MGERGKSEDSRQAPTRKTRDAVDRRQNNRMLRQCPLGIAQQLVCYTTAALTFMRNSHNVRSSAVGNLSVLLLIAFIQL